MRLKNNQLAFFTLVRAGLWGQDVQLLPLGKIDYSQVLSLAEEQSVVGLVAEGLDHVCDIRVAKSDMLQFIGQTIYLEQRNLAMNSFIGRLIKKMREEGIYSLLVKGQGIAQCYERPLWRACGDIDLLLSKDNYAQAVLLLTPLAYSVDEEDSYSSHLAMTIDQWVVELHGSLKSGLWKRFDKVIGEVQGDLFYGGNVRSWMNGSTQVFLPGVNEDVFFVFSHILQHYFKEGIGLRQICDWCRLLWTYRESIDIKILESRLRKAGAMTEWKAFASLAVDYLGMPVDAMPFYNSSSRWSRKANRIISFVLETGNFGHNRDYSYYHKHSVLVYKTISLSRHIKDTVSYSFVFPLDSLKVLGSRVVFGVKELFKGKRKD